MRLTEATVTIRPRTPWEAIDLGVLMARQHRRLLMVSWALATLPVFALLTLVLWTQPSFVFLIFWWLKPLFDRLPLAILSQTLFGTTPTVRQALRLWLGSLRRQWLPSLTYRRFSLSRSYALPVQQLEGLGGDERAQRLAALGQAGLRAPRSLTLAGSSLEMCLWFGAMTLVYAFVPQQTEMNWDWLRLLGNEDQLNWVEHLTNLFYPLILILWEPIYVACGFSLYLNRRTQLEAWDIELTFRRLRQRLAGAALVCLLALGTLMAPAQPVWAEPGESSMCPLPPLDDPEAEEDVASPDADRLTHQPVTSRAARDDVEALLKQPPFRNPLTTHGWRLKQDDKAKPDSTTTRKHTPEWLRILLDIAGMATTAAKYMLWGLVGLAAFILLWRYRRWLATFVAGFAPRGMRMRRPVIPPSLNPRADPLPLPDDLASSAERLWQTAPREAVSLLYRGMLTRLSRDYRLSLADAATEGEVLAQVDRLGLDELSVYAHSLTGHWQSLAYGHRLPSAQTWHRLCAQWRGLFDGVAP